MTAPGLQIDKALLGPSDMDISANSSSQATQRVNKRLLAQTLLVFVLSCLAGVGWLAYQNMQAAVVSERWETHTRVVIQELGELLSSLKDAETGQRGFVITGNPDYLVPYHQSLKTFPARLAQLRRLTADSPEEQQRLAALTPLAAAEFADIKAIIALRQTRGLQAVSESALVESGKSRMDQIRLLVAQSQAQQTQRLRECVLKSQSDSHKSMQSLLLTSALGGLALLLMLFSLRWERTSRRRAETAQKAGGALLRVATDAAELGIWTWQPDGDRITWENERSYEIVGLAQTDTPVTAARFAAKFVHADDLAALEQAIADTLKTGVRFFYQGRFHHPNGELRWIEFTGQLVPGPDGLRLVGTMCNITSRKQAEESLRKSQETLELALEIGKIGVRDWDMVADTLVWSERRKAMSGLQPDAEVNAMLAMATTHADDKPRVQAARTLALQTGRDSEVEFRTVWPDGSVRWLHARMRVVKDAGGKPVRFTSVTQDVTERRASEKALHESEAFSRSILKSSADCVKVLDLDGNLLSMQSGQDLLGIEDIRPFLNKSWLDFWTSDHHDRRAAQAALVAVLAGGTGAFVGFFQTLRGEAKWWDVLISPILDAGGKPARLLVVARDVTERKHAELKMRENEERYRNLFNSMDEGFCIIDIEFNQQAQAVDCRFLEVNPAFALQTGMHDIAGKRWCEFAPGREAGWLEICGGVALTGKPVRFNHEETLLDLKFDMYAARLGNAESRKVAIVFNNITERAKAAEALRQSEHRFRALFNLGPVAMYSCDTSGIILEFNACAVKLWGRKPTPEDVEERFCGVTKIYRPDGALLAAEQNPMIAVLKGEMPQVDEIEAVIERTDGSRITVIASIVPLKDSHGKIIGAMNCFYDITERSRLQRQTQDQAQALTDLHRRKDEFLAMLSHELRNPLAPLTSAVELLGRQENQDPVYRQACQVIERQVGQMKHLIDDLLEVSRITSGNVRLRKAPVRVSDIVERALETTRPLIASRRQQLTLSMPPQPVWLDADATRLEQVLVNLLNNASKYTHEEGLLWLSVAQEDEAGSASGGSVAVIRVRDTGMGIAEELLPHVFDLFTQAERTIDRSQGGMGIGLNLVRQMLELHGGSVNVHSVLGQGSEFVVRLPVTPPPLSLPPPVAVPVRPAGKGCRVLVVDDSVDAVEFLAKLLRLSGHTIEVAHDGPGAVQAALAMRPDVVLLDIGLPGLTGYEVAKRLRQEATLDSTVLVALTGYGRASDRQRSRNAGFSYHLVKPAGVREIEEILATVGEQLALQTPPAQIVVPLT